MSFEDTKYALYWALSGITKPRATITFLRERRRVERETAAATGAATAAEAAAGAGATTPAGTGAAAGATTGAPATPGESTGRPTTPLPLEDLGTVERLTILPLVEFYATEPHLATEAGVSYLIDVDGKKILFDVGANDLDEEPSPLMRNMEALGVKVSDLDAIFISHYHLDHVGGKVWMDRKSFSLSKQQVDVGGIPAYTPIPMSHPSATLHHLPQPTRIGEGLASTGPLERAIWLSGTVAEHALLVNVRDKGPVMIVGCGHPQLERLVERAQAVTGMPLYGVLGGLHFPVTGSRAGKGRQNIIGNGKLPWQRITKREAEQAAAFLASLDLGLVALSGHDSCDWTLDAFREALGDRYRLVRVGEEIVV